jgi:hypothetical protein
MPSVFVKHWVEHRKKCFGDADPPASFRDFIDTLRSDTKYCHPLPCTEHVMAVEGDRWENFKKNYDSSTFSRLGATELIEDEFLPGYGKLANDRYNQATSLQQLRRAARHDRQADREYAAEMGRHKTCSHSNAPLCASYFDHMLLGSCKHNFFGLNFQAGLFLSGFVIGLSTAEEKFTVLIDERLYPEWHPLHGSSPTGHVVHHIMSFEDLQSPGDEVTEYSLNYDFITDQILIQKTKGTEQKPWAADYAQTQGMLFCGSPAALIHKIRNRETIAPSRGFDLVCKLIASEWMMLMHNELMNIKVPAEHQVTFTPQLLLDLSKWMISAYEGPALENIPFTSVWGPREERVGW